MMEINESVNGEGSNTCFASLHHSRDIALTGEWVKEEKTGNVLRFLLLEQNIMTKSKLGERGVFGLHFHVIVHH